MKRIYHFCLSGKNELICRTDPDYYRAFNTLALAAHETDSSLLAESIMSNHIHVCVRSADIKEFVKKFRYSYGRYFNNKYGRRGQLGEENCFISEIDGFYHVLAAICYILRNAMHHGISPTAFAYKHCSASALFMKERGIDTIKTVISPRSHYRYIPRSAQSPSNYKMSPSGVFLRENVLDVNDTEHYFGTVRSYLYYMNRLSGEEWTKEQERDMNGKEAISLSSIEKAYSPSSVKEMLRNEHGRRAVGMNDIELCSVVDNILLREIGASSIYTISEQERRRLLERAHNECLCPERQLRRCLGFREV